MKIAVLRDSRSSSLRGCRCALGGKNCLEAGGCEFMARFSKVGFGEWLGTEARPPGLAGVKMGRETARSIFKHAKAV